MYPKKVRQHQCPICKDWHEGRYQLCEACQEAQAEAEANDESDYDYATDDFNFEVRNRR